MNYSSLYTLDIEGAQPKKHTLRKAAISPTYNLNQQLMVKKEEQPESFITAGNQASRKNLQQYNPITGVQLSNSNASQITKQKSQSLIPENLVLQRNIENFFKGMTPDIQSRGKYLQTKQILEQRAQDIKLDNQVQDKDGFQKNLQLFFDGSSQSHRSNNQQQQQQQEDQQQQAKRKHSYSQIIKNQKELEQQQNQQDILSQYQQQQKLSELHPLSYNKQQKIQDDLYRLQQVKQNVQPQYLSTKQLQASQFQIGDNSSQQQLLNQDQQQHPLTVSKQQIQQQYLDQLKQAQYASANQHQINTKNLQASHWQLGQEDNYQHPLTMNKQQVQQQELERLKQGIKQNQVISTKELQSSQWALGNQVSQREQLQQYQIKSASTTPLNNKTVNLNQQVANQQDPNQQREIHPLQQSKAEKNQRELERLGQYQVQEQKISTNQLQQSHWGLGDQNNYQDLNIKSDQKEAQALVRRPEQVISTQQLQQSNWQIGQNEVEKHLGKKIYAAQGKSADVHNIISNEGIELETQKPGKRIFGQQQTALIAKNENPANRVFVLSDSDSQSKEFIKKYLQIRNINNYEEFCLPGSSIGIIQQSNQDWLNCFLAVFNFLNQVKQFNAIYIFDSLNSVANPLIIDQTKDWNQKRLAHNQCLRDAKKLIESSLQNANIALQGYLIDTRGNTERVF